MRFEKVSFDSFLKDFTKYYKYSMSVDNYKSAYQEIKLPERSTEKSAGYDFYAPCSFFIFPGEDIILPSGIKCFFNKDEGKNWHLKLYARSSLGIKHKIVLTNGTGIIDADYYNNPDNEGDILISLHNFGPKGVRIQAGDKIMQGIFEAYALTENDFASGIRRGGVGSTGR